MYTFIPIIIIIMFVIENVYLLLKISKYLSNQLICYSIVKKLATAVRALTIIKKTYHQFNSGIHLCWDTYYLFLRMGSLEFVTHQRWETFILSKGGEDPYKGRMSRACWEIREYSIIKLKSKHHVFTFFKMFYHYHINIYCKNKYSYNV